MPIQIKSKRDSGNAKLPPLQDNKEVLVLFQTLRDLVHHIGLSAEKISHLLQAMLFGFNA